jgi:hypothetical protein
MEVGHELADAELTPRSRGEDAEHEGEVLRPEESITIHAPMI